MSRTLSDRAQRYLQTFKRRPHVSDLQLVRKALKAADVPITQAVLDFHETFAGYLVDVWGDEGALGIIHPTIEAHESFCEPMEVGGYLDDEEPEKSMLACADIHMSWEMLIELDGTYHCNGPLSSSYFAYTEQSAFMWDFWNSRVCERPELPEDGSKILADLEKDLARHRIDAVSDEYCQIYATDRFAVMSGQGGEWLVMVAEGEWPSELDALKSKPVRKRKK
jgi:hypothetical protein